MGEGFDVFAEVGAEDNGAILRRVPDELAHLDPLKRVQTGRGLVEDENPRVMDEGLRERDPPLLTSREAAIGSREQRTKIQLIDHVRDCARPLRCRQAVRPRREGQHP